MPLRVSPTRPLLPRVLLLLLILAGIALSIYVARQDARQYEMVERLRIAERVDDHFGSVNEHVLDRKSVV